VILALPVLLAPPLGPHLLDSSYASMMPQALTFLAFTVYQDMGTTIMLAKQGVLGTSVACAYSHMMHAMMPGGASGDSYSPVLAHCSYILFVFTALWLNFPKNTTMFMLSYHAYFAMDLVNPHQADFYNDSWHIRYDAYPVTTIVTAVVGVFFAILATAFPYPVLAQDAATKSAIYAAHLLNNIVEDISGYYQGSAANASIFNSEKDILELQELAASMEANIENSWWEGSSSRFRELLQHQQQLLQEMFYSMNAMYLCAIQEDFSESHQKCMAGVRAEVNAVTTSTKDLLIAATLAIDDGMVTAGEMKSLEKIIVKARRSNEELTRAFDKNRRDVFPDAVAMEHLTSENLFVYSVSTLGRRVADYAERLGDEYPHDSLITAMGIYFQKLVDAKTLIWDRQYRSFVLRNTFSMLISFYLGFFFFNYNATGAGTVALLISNYTGSALQKNLGRLQGVALAQIFPHIYARILGTGCDFMRVAFLGFGIFIWELFTNYIYYSSPAFGYIALLAGALGAPILVYPCAAFVNAETLAAQKIAFEVSSYVKIAQTAIAALVLTIVDVVLAPERASEKAIDEILKVFVRLDAGMAAACRQRESDGRISGGPINNRHLSQNSFFHDAAEETLEFIDAKQRSPETILALLQSAKSFSEEANKEPRYFRGPWPEEFVKQVLNYSNRMLILINEIEHALKGSNQEYNHIFRDLHSNNSLKPVEVELMNVMEKTMKLTRLVLLNEIGQRQKQQVKDVAAQGVPDMINSMPAFRAAINQQVKYSEKVEQYLEDDVVCRINVVLVLMEAAMVESTALIKKCLAEA